MATFTGVIDREGIFHQPVNSSPLDHMPASLRCIEGKPVRPPTQTRQDARYQTSHSGYSSLMEHLLGQRHTRDYVRSNTDALSD